MVAPQRTIDLDLAQRSNSTWSNVACLAAARESFISRKTHADEGGRTVSSITLDHWPECPCKFKELLELLCKASKLKIKP